MTVSIGRQRVTVDRATTPWSKFVQTMVRVWTFCGHVLIKLMLGTDLAVA